MIAVRFGYILEDARNSQSYGHDPVVASGEVDPDVIDPEQLREALRVWAIAELSAQKCDFGLYTAEFGAWDAEATPGYYVRMLYIVWNGEEPILVHSDDSDINFAGVLALARQADAFDASLGLTRVPVSTTTG